MKQLINFFKKFFTHNHCDSCGFTKSKVYVTEYYSEGGFIQCENCINKTNKK
jgi:hypothetical protein